MILIKFIRSACPYNPGETAGFNERDAAYHIKAGNAVLVKVNKPKYEETKSVSAPEVNKAVLAAPVKKGKKKRTYF